MSVTALTDKPVLMLPCASRLMISRARRSETYRYRDAKLAIVFYSSVPRNDDEALVYAAHFVFGLWNDKTIYVERAADTAPNGWVTLPYTIEDGEITLVEFIGRR